MHENDAVRYIQTSKVQGWLPPVAAEVTVLLLRQSSAEGRPVAEIGVHHGRYLIFLGLLTRGRITGFDLFESRQAENIDGSGAGNRATFLENAQRYGIGGDKCVAVIANSTELDGQQVLTACGAPPVFFSVDGGHTAELTESDIRVAEASVADDGVVAVDDVFNERWPSVMLGLGRYLGDGSPVLVPCAIGGGKVFLAKGADRARELATALQDDHSTAIGYITSASSTALGNWPVTVLETKIRAETLLRGIAGTPLGVSASRSFLGRRLKTLLRPFY